MADNQEKSPAGYPISATPPQDLFSRIIRRLGLEKELSIVKKNLEFFSILLLLFLVLSIFAFVGVKHVLTESSFGPLLSLVFSDPGIVIKYWHSFTFSVFESIPGFTVAGFIFSLAFLMLFIRFVFIAVGKIILIIKSINKQKYGNK